MRGYDLGSVPGGPEAVRGTHRFPHKGVPLAEPTGTNFNLEQQEQRASGPGGGTSLSKAQAGVWLTFRPPAPTAWKLCSHLWA